MLVAANPGLIIASRKRVGRNPLMIHTIIFWEVLWLRRGALLLLFFRRFYCLFHIARTAVLFTSLLYRFPHYLPSYLSVRALYKKGEQSTLLEVKWLGKEQTELVLSSCLVLSFLPDKCSLIPAIPLCGCSPHYLSRTNASVKDHRGMHSRIYN